MKKEKYIVFCSVKSGIFSSLSLSYLTFDDLHFISIETIRSVGGLYTHHSVDGNEEMKCNDFLNFLNEFKVYFNTLVLVSIRYCNIPSTAFVSLFHVLLDIDCVRRSNMSTIPCTAQCTFDLKSFETFSIANMS